MYRMKQKTEESASKYALGIANKLPLGSVHYGKFVEVIENAYMQGAEWQEKQSQWISVTDAIPKEDAKGLCIVKWVDGSTSVMVMRHVYRWVHPYIKRNAVTHWKPKGGEE